MRKLGLTSSKAVIEQLKIIVSEHGIPEKIISDIGPQYAAEEFHQSVESYAITHITSSPLYPQSNGFIERTAQWELLIGRSWPNSQEHRVQARMFLTSRVCLSPSLDTCVHKISTNP